MALLNLWHTVFFNCEIKDAFPISNQVCAHIYSEMLRCNLYQQIHPWFCSAYKGISIFKTHMIKSFQRAFAMQLGSTSTLSPSLMSCPSHPVIRMENIVEHCDQRRGTGVKEAVVRNDFCMSGEFILSVSPSHTPASPGEGSL